MHVRGVVAHSEQRLAMVLAGWVGQCKQGRAWRAGRVGKASKAKRGGCSTTDNANCFRRSEP
eukprot:2495057-Alexandrium_andersonii.AAC.1